MDGKLRMDPSGLDVRKLTKAIDDAAPRALAMGAEHIRAAAVELTPVETGRLAGTAAVHVDGDTASITYDGPYARYQHERLDLRHEHGQAKFLEQPLATEKDTALGIVAEQIRQAL
jgi:hypothetical protein